MNKPSRPQPFPTSIKKATNQPTTRQAGTKPVAPPVYRPQAIPKVLQRKTATIQPRPSCMTKHMPAAPPVYRPQPTPKVLQRKAVGARQPTPSPHSNHLPAAPPVYRPQPAPKVLQTKTAIASRPNGLSRPTPVPAPTCRPQHASRIMQAKFPKGVSTLSGAQGPKGSVGNRGAAVIQRTLAGAKTYASKNPYMDTYTVRNRTDVEDLILNTAIPQKDRIELMAKYNNGMSQEQQIYLIVPEAMAAAQNVAVQIDGTNYFNSWSGGQQKDSQANADSHFFKHIVGQKEFAGKYNDVVEYTKGALEFASRKDVIEDMQKGGNWGKYTYGPVTRKGEMVVLNGESGKLASYYELKGSPEEVAKYIQGKLKASSWMEVLEKLKQSSTPMSMTHTSSSPIPIPTSSSSQTFNNNNSDTPPNIPEGGWPDTPPGLSGMKTY
jgi:hypothetical protein